MMGKFESRCAEIPLPILTKLKQNAFIANMVKVAKALNLHVSWKDADKKKKKKTPVLRRLTMDLDEIKRGLRAEIKKRENEQYFTFQTNIRQMCKDVLAKLEEQESAIAQLRDKCQMHDFFWEGCGFAKRGFKNTIAISNAFDNLETENAKLEKQIKFLKVTHNSCGNCNKCADGMGKVFDENLNELKDKCQMHEKEIRHHKYKSCMMMALVWRNYAAFCGMQSACHNHRGFGKTAEKWTWKQCHAWKCVRRYRELAKTFKAQT